MWTLHLRNWKYNTLLPSFPQGLRFVDDVYKFWTGHSFDSQVFDPQCKSWVLLLLQLVDVTKEHPEVHLQSFLGKSTLGVVKKYRDDITKHVRKQLDSSLSGDGTMCNIVNREIFVVKNFS